MMPAEDTVRLLSFYHDYSCTEYIYSTKYPLSSQLKDAVLQEEAHLHAERLGIKMPTKSKRGDGAASHASQVAHPHRKQCTAAAEQDLTTGLLGVATAAGESRNVRAMPNHDAKPPVKTVEVVYYSGLSRFNAGRGGSANGRQVAKIREATASERCGSETGNGGLEKGEGAKTGGWNCCTWLTNWVTSLLSDVTQEERKASADATKGGTTERDTARPEKYKST
jgi:hypothetical protein